MKKLIVLAFVPILLLCFNVNMNAQEDVVRIHIRANSDSEYDQAIKLQVRDKVNEYIAPLISEAKTKKDAMEIFEECKPQLQRISEEVSGKNCSVDLKEEYFPKKTYNDKVYPEGEYTALIIEIGEGEGRNWWCVAFPNMCYTSSEKKVEYKWFFVELLERIGIL